MSVLQLGLNNLPAEPEPPEPKASEAGAERTGLNTGALSGAPTYSDFVPSMHSNMTMTSPLPPVEPQYAPDATLHEKVEAVLKTCYDPEIPVDIYQLGLIYEIFAPRADDRPNHVKVLMTLTAPNCPAAQTLPAEAKYKIERLEEVDDAEIEITFDPPWTPEKMSEEAKLVLNLI